jgi:hypothetical protein
VASANIDDLLEEFETEPFTERIFLQERAYLVREFLMTCSVHADDIDEMIRTGELHQTELTARWVALHELGRYVSKQLSRPT